MKLFCSGARRPIIHCIKQYYFYFLVYFIDRKSGIFWEKNFFFKVLVEGLNIIQFSQSKNEGNPKLLVYLVIYGCCGVFPASIELKK